MDSRISRKPHLKHHPWPSPSEKLQARYAGDWEIYRELLRGGTHGDWVAKRLRPTQDGTDEIRATSVDSLAQKLEVESEEDRDA
jgi:hypothetical protein